MHFAEKRAARGADTAGLVNALGAHFAGGIAYVMAYTAVLRIAQHVEDQVAKA